MEVVITDEDALRKAYPQLFKLDKVELKRVLKASAVLGQHVVGAHLAAKVKEEVQA